MPVRGPVTRLLAADMGDAAVSAGLGVAPTTLALVDADAATTATLLARNALGGPRLILAVRAAASPPSTPLWPVRIEVRHAGSGTACLGGLEVEPV